MTNNLEQFVDDEARVWILGASDPEMARIEALLDAAGERYVYALAGGQRVRPEMAYRADDLSAPIPARAAVYAVECDGPAMPRAARRVDHHRPGDPGYGRPAAEFLPASSLGQVVSLLAALGRIGHAAWGPPIAWSWEDLSPGRVPAGTLTHVEPDWFPEDDRPTGWVVQTLDGSKGDPGEAVWVPWEIVAAAAADHCLGAAYRGECPGVEPDALMHWRLTTRAAHQRRSVEAVLADVEAARAALRAAPRIELRPGDPATAVADLRGQEIPELPEAAAREGIAFLATPLPRPGERPKVVLQVATPAQLAAWPAWAAAHGLRDLYGGDPARGFAGGYLA